MIPQVVLWYKNIKIIKNTDRNFLFVFNAFFGFWKFKISRFENNYPYGQLFSKREFKKL